ncbi:hypothetical protein RAA17_21275 [Komagataeibacter rhaeticus]|nr:hypothetical protein [Komagataeibacter rhaeticus]
MHRLGTREEKRSYARRSMADTPMPDRLQARMEHEVHIFSLWLYPSSPTTG